MQQSLVAAIWMGRGILTHGRIEEGRGASGCPLAMPDSNSTLLAGYRAARVKYVLAPCSSRQQADLRT